MRKLVLKTGVACLAIAGLGLSMPALAYGEKPVVQPVTKRFQSESREAADRTVTVVQTGNIDSGSELHPYTPQGDVEEVIALTGDQVAAERAAHGAPPVIACPQDGNSAEWQQVPEEIRRNAKPGQCFSRLLRAPKVETYREHAVVQPERVETRTVPEVVDTVEENVIVTPERYDRRVVPAVTHVEKVTEVVRPAGFREEIIPAQYETRTEKVMVTPPHEEWVRQDGIPTGADLVTPVDHAPVRYRADGTLTWPGKDPQNVPVSRETAEYLKQGSGQTIWCLKLIPGVYEARTTKVVVVPEQVRRIEIPAETRVVERVVVDVPEHYEEYVVPAVVEKRRVRKVVEAARTESVTVPAVYDDVSRQRVIGEPEPVWREVICGKNASPRVIMDVQRALASRGYQPGPIDGQMGKQTVSAMQKFQADNGLPQGQPSVEAVQLLGVRLD